MNNNAMLGLKLFKEDEKGNFKIVRVTSILPKDRLKVMSEDTGKEVTQSKKSLSLLGYKILESIGVITFSIVKVHENEDVVVTLVRKNDIKLGLSVPCVICRQSVTDFFYNLLANVEDHGLVGVSVSERTCPTNINYSHLLACDDIVYSNMVNIYYDDTIDSILKCIPINKYNACLTTLFNKHIESSGNPTLKLKNEDKGWCKNIRDLLIMNNFWIDVDQAYQITDVDFKIDEHIIEKKDESGANYNSLAPDVMRFLSSTFQLNIVDTIVIKYYYDIDLAEYHNENYILLRDSTEKLYLVTYLVEGQYLEQDLVIAEEKKHLADSYRLKIYSKYND